MVIFTERNDADRFHEALKMIEKGRREIEELSEKMRIQYGERGTRGDRDGDGRYNERYDGGYKGYPTQMYDQRYDQRYDNRDGSYGERRDPMGRFM